MRTTMGLVLDCRDPEALAEFWSEALGYTTLGGAGNYVMLVDGDGAGPKLLLQRVPEPKAGKNRMHLDMETPDVGAEVERLEKLGASKTGETCSEHGMRWTVMAAPEGNEFCVCDDGSDGQC